jgi:hypothetical protein
VPTSVVTTRPISCRGVPRRRCRACSSAQARSSDARDCVAGGRRREPDVFGSSRKWTRRPSSYRVTCHGGRDSQTCVGRRDHVIRALTCSRLGIARVVGVVMPRGPETPDAGETATRRSRTAVSSTWRNTLNAIARLLRDSPRRCRWASRRPRSEGRRSRSRLAPRVGSTQCSSASVYTSSVESLTSRTAKYVSIHRRA